MFSCEKNGILIRLIMKTIELFLISVLLVCSSIVLEGQPGKGKLLLGGSSSLSLTIMSDKFVFGEESNDGGKETEITFSPQAGYFLTDGLITGFLIPFNMNSYSYNDHTLTRTSVAFAPFARHYFGKSVFRPFLQGSAGLGYLKSKDDSGSESGTMFLWEVDGGMSIFIRNNIALDIEFGYSSSTLKVKDSDTFYPDKEINHGLGLSVGFSFIL
jgi:opacity protein-like surface antigen